MTLFRQFIKKPGITGALAPSSLHLMAKMLDPIDFSRAKVIVELGVGNGCLTREILRRMRKDAFLLAFEINRDLVDSVKIDDSRLTLVHDLADNFHNYVENEAVDVIVSSLPISNFSKERLRLLCKRMRKSIKSSGQYVQFQYTPRRLGILREFFSVRVSFTPLNLPPAWIYACEKETY